MASIDYNDNGIVLYLETTEVDSVCSATDDLKEVIVALLAAAFLASKLPQPVGALVIAILVSFFATQRIIVKQVNKSPGADGVLLTVPWPLLFIGGITTVVTTPHYPNTSLPPKTWSELDEGKFGTNDDVDLISYTIEHGVQSPDVVTFRLQIGSLASGWAKIIVMPDGLGSQWEIKAEGFKEKAAAENSLWAEQVLNGQSLTFKKPKAIGIWAEVLHLGDLGKLHGGDKVTFVWEKDS